MELNEKICPHCGHEVLCWDVVCPGCSLIPRDTPEAKRIEARWRLKIFSPMANSEVVRLLRDLIRFDTSNPPGNERPAVDYIAGLLKEEGVPFEIVEPEPRRANVVARLKGDGSRSPGSRPEASDSTRSSRRFAAPEFSRIFPDGLGAANRL